MNTRRLRGLTHWNAGKARWLGLGLVIAGILIRAVGAEKLTRLLSSSSKSAKSDRHASSRVQIACPVEKVYDFVRQPENAAKYMQHIDGVERKDAHHARWIMRTPGGIRVTWEGELVEDRPLKRLVWQWRERGAFAGAMALEFTPLQEGQGTIVDLTFVYERTSAPLETVFAELLADPSAQADTSLRQLKRFLETPEPEPLEPVAEREGINQGGSGSGLNI